jgi:hypothetical protein
MADGEDMFRNNPTSWYYRLSKCMIEVLLPVIDLLAEDYGRKRKTILDKSYIDNYLLTAWTGRVATSETTSGDRLPDPEQLLIPKLSLAEWDEHLRYDKVYKLMGLDDTTESKSDPQKAENKIEDWRAEVRKDYVHITEDNALSIERDLSEAVLETLPQVSYGCHYLMHLDSHRLSSTSFCAVVSCFSTSNYSRAPRYHFRYRNDQLQHLGSDCPHDSTSLRQKRTLSSSLRWCTTGSTQD